MEKKRGGQTKHWAERARILVWYKEIKRRCDWTDYKLSYEFAWTQEGKALRTSENRSKVFEWIRKSARKPEGRDKRWHNMSALVEEVDKHPFFHDTKQLYYSDFWSLLHGPKFTPRELQTKLDEFLQKNDLVQLNPDTHTQLNNLVEKYGLEPVYNRCLLLCLREINNIEGLNLTWLLYMQTEPVHSSKLKAVVESIADKQLMDFFESYFNTDNQLNYYSEAIKVLLNLKLDTLSGNQIGYGFLDQQSKYLVIPKVYQKDISEKVLFIGLLALEELIDRKQK